MADMVAAFLVPGYSPDKTFTDPDLDELKHAMAAQGALLSGVTSGWGEQSVQDFGQRALEQLQHCEYNGILIGHSLGALAALSIVDQIPLRHLVLCSPSALFSEDINTNLDPALAQRIGQKRVQELKFFSALDASSLVNDLRIPTTILFGEKECELHPYLVARCGQLASVIANAELIEVAGAAHFIGEQPYANELARVVGRIATELTVD